MTRHGEFMIFAVLAGAAVAFWYQIQFEVPRERQTDLFPKIATFTFAVLIIVRAAVVTVVQRRRRR